MQGNGQKCNNEWCPNTIFSNGSVSIGEFKTLEEAMNFPKKEIWCINRTNDNLFNKYQSQGVRVLIVCDWVKPTQDSQKFVVALVGKNGKISYWDMNDMPINPKIYENSIDNDVLYAIYSVADEMYKNNNQENINCNRNMNKKLIRLTESDLHRIVRESVNKVLNEIGDTKRGQNLIGQVAARAMHRGDYQTMFDALDRRSKEDDTNFIHGHNDRLDVINNPDTSSKEGRRARLKMQNNYEVADMEDMDAIGRKFINFIEKHGGGVMMQTIADYESGNQTGRPESGFPAVLEVFEDEVLGYDCSPKIKTALKRAYTQWWHYAQDELMPDEEY